MPAARIVGFFATVAALGLAFLIVSWIYVQLRDSIVTQLYGSPDKVPSFVRPMIDAINTLGAAMPWIIFVTLVVTILAEIYRYTHEGEERRYY